MWSAPDEVERPRLSALSSSSVLVSWSKPQRPNGIITQYIIERRLSPAAAVSVTTVACDDDVEQTYCDYVDFESVQPYTQYEYRVAAETSAGLTYSAWSHVLTRPASECASSFHLH